MRNTVIFFLLLGACVSIPPHLRLYTGPPRPWTETAMLETDSDAYELITIVQVDETSAKDLRVEVLPGYHTVTITWVKRRDPNRGGTVAIPMYAKAGRRYRFYLSSALLFWKLRKIKIRDTMGFPPTRTW